jgi:L-ascorbate metabolism protein UlaG (beta-lactamase superfamily)
MEKHYLKPNVLAEPLIGGWYAWTHLIPPANAGMNVVDRHLKIMRSFVQAPQLHVAAVNNPAMLGGPFVKYGPERVNDVKQLIAWTESEQRQLIVLAGAIKELDGLLAREAKGYSLEPLYARVPEPLRGYVELVYDLNCAPSCRFIEPLLYHSSYYHPAYQRIALSLTERDGDRPFVLSTPRLAEAGTLMIDLPFADPALDELFKLKRQPQTRGYVKELLRLGDAGDEMLDRFLTTEPPAPYSRYDGDGVRTRYFGHACILVESKQVTILSDPVISYEVHSDLPRYTYADLPEVIDYVVITHNHQDHVLIETMLQLRHKIGTVVVPRSGGGGLQDPSLKLALERIGFRSVREIGELETLEIDGGAITGVPFMGEHSDLDIRTKMAYLVKLGQGSLMLAADSCNVEPKIYEHVHQLTGDVDILFLGMECDGAPLSWLYGPLLTRPLDRKMDHSRRLSGSNYERGIDIVNRFSCREAYVYAMGMEPWLRYIMAKEYTPQSDPIIASNRLIEDCRSRGITAERLFGEREIAVA